jgi:hypothetical protein
MERGALDRSFEDQEYYSAKVTMNLGLRRDVCFHFVTKDWVGPDRNLV